MFCDNSFHRDLYDFYLRNLSMFLQVKLSVFIADLFFIVYFLLLFKPLCSYLGRRLIRCVRSCILRATPTLPKEFAFDDFYFSFFFLFNEQLAPLRSYGIFITPKQSKGATRRCSSYFITFQRSSSQIEISRETEKNSTTTGFHFRRYSSRSC